MTAYELMVNIEDYLDSDIKVRAWIAPEPQPSSGGRRELPLECRARNRFRATFALRREDVDAFLYRLEIEAPAGTRWSMEVREATGDRRPLLADGDRLLAPKASLIGWVAERPSPDWLRPSIPKWQLDRGQQDQLQVDRRSLRYRAC